MMDFILLSGPNFFVDSVILIALALSVSIIGLSFMFGEFLAIPTLKAYSKSEIRELGVTAAIIIIVILLATPGGIFDNVGRGIAPPPEGGGAPKFCPEWTAAHGTYDSGSGTFQKADAQGKIRYSNYAFSQADYFLGCRWNWKDIVLAGVPYLTGDHGILLPKMVGAYMHFMAYEAATGLVSTFSININVPENLFSPFGLNYEITNVIPGSFMTLVNDAHTLLVDIICTMVAAVAAQKMLLTFIDLNVLSTILPFGLLMRAFPFTRKTGSTIIAFCFAAYFIYPLSILINYRVYESIQNPPQCTGPLPSGISQIGGSCAKDSDCCSNNCRLDKCVQQITDFKEYGSTFAICNEADLSKSQSALEQTLNAEEKREQEYLKALQDAQLASTDPPSKTLGRLELQQEIDKTVQQLKATREQEAESNKWVLPTVNNMWNLFGLFEIALLDTPKVLVLMTLFIVNEIVISLTLFKDFSLLIGGEPRLLGISKLV